MVNRGLGHSSHRPLPLQMPLDAVGTTAPTQPSVERNRTCSPTSIARSSTPVPPRQCREGALTRLHDQCPLLEAGSVPACSHGLPGIPLGLTHLHESPHT